MQLLFNILRCIFRVFLNMPPSVCLAILVSASLLQRLVMALFPCQVESLHRMAVDIWTSLRSTCPVIKYLLVISVCMWWMGQWLNNIFWMFQDIQQSLRETMQEIDNLRVQVGRVRRIVTEKRRVPRRVPPTTTSNRVGSRLLSPRQ
jgi:hypothetical protein